MDDVEVKEVEVLPLPCRHLHRLTTKQETKPRSQGWHISVTCHCGKSWSIRSNKGALEASPTN